MPDLGLLYVGVTWFQATFCSLLSWKSGLHAGQLQAPGNKSLREGDLSIWEGNSSAKQLKKPQAYNTLCAFSICSCVHHEKKGKRNQKEGQMGEENLIFCPSIIV